jgi:hypothetical protein
MANKSERGFTHIVLAIVLVAVLAGVGFFVYHRNHPTNSSATSTTQIKKPSVITDLQFSKTVDAKGVAVSPMSKFSVSDPTIYAVLTLKNPAKDSRLEFVRYRDNKFVGNGSIKVTKEGVNYAGFKWTAKPGKSHPSGTYKVKVYNNGRYERSATYTVN